MKRLAIVVLLLLVLVGVSLLWWKTSLLPVNSSDKKTQTFIVPKGNTVREVARNLRDEKLIRDQIAYFILIRLGLEKNPQAGSFQLSPSMSIPEIAETLTHGTEDLRITIPEGWRSEEIVEYLKKQNISGPNGDWNEEGKYFPETYLVSKSTTIDGVRQLMRQTFDRKVPNISIDNLILASLVEREGRTNEDRPVIAGILLNRLDNNMALQVDATLQYLLGYQTREKSWWKKELTDDDKKVKSAYNTYLNPGLPPAPIANPGLAAINAVLNPAKTDYLYYLHDSFGEAHFAKTLAEHNANAAKYIQ